MEHQTTTASNIWRASILSINDIEICTTMDNIEISRGDFVVMPTRYGDDLARIVGKVRGEVDTTNIRTIIRIASEEDLKTREELESMEDETRKKCLERVECFGLPMKVVSVHFVLDGQKLVVLFTADSRVDFRELVRDLANQYHKRIELRQIGLRDSTRVLGGVSVCGQNYCCHTITDKLASVSMKMAKDQNLSPNSLKLSGGCGRLMCCLSYEQDYYVEERRKTPRKGISIVHDDQIYTVTKVSVLTHKVQLTSSQGELMETSSSNLVLKDDGQWVILD